MPCRSGEVGGKWRGFRDVFWKPCFFLLPLKKVRSFLVLALVLIRHHHLHLRRQKRLRHVATEWHIGKKLVQLGYMPELYQAKAIRNYLIR